METAHAIDVFMRGSLGVPSAENRSERRTAGGIPVLHFDDAWNRGRRVADEFIVCAQTPAAALASIAAYQPVPNQIISLIDRPSSDHDAYLAAGYRHSATESLMVRALTDLPPLDSRYVVARADTAAQLAWLNDHDPAGSAWLTPAKLHAPGLRHSFIALDQRPVARARVCRVDADARYVEDVYTADAYRRRGLARALMAQILHEAAAHGEQWSVLISSAAGMPLYASLGYQHRASIAVFKPRPTPASPA